MIEYGSADNTSKICQSLEKQYPELIITHKIPLPSYGQALKQGILAASADAALIVELDALDLEFFAVSLRALEEGRGRFHCRVEAGIPVLKTAGCSHTCSTPG